MLYKSLLGPRMFDRAAQLSQMVDRLHCATGKNDWLVTIKERSHREDKGLFVYDTDWPNEPRIYVDPGGVQPSLVLAHELGHFLEFCLINDGDPEGLHRDLFEPWWNAVRSSNAYGYLCVAFEKRALFARNSDGGSGWRHATPRQLDDLCYYLQKHELWARSYAQYVATSYKTTRTYAEMVALHNSDAGQTFQAQREPEDFAPISREVHGILARLGWLHAIKCGC
ncbi:hypothetical protein BH11ARM2_BH11ARM2_11120 [soil metagenome]